MYYEFQTNELLERMIDPTIDKTKIDPQVLGEIMYTFLSVLQEKESERLILRNMKLKQNPLGSLMDRCLGQKARPKERRKLDSSDDSEGEDQVPIGYDYSENFPALPDFDGKGKQMRLAAERRQRLQAAAGDWGSGEFNYVTNHAREIKPLNDIKAHFKQLAHSVIQDLYNVFNDVGMVDEILKMTFPMFKDSNVGLDRLNGILKKDNL